jgi:SH3-like domain-containing protein
VRSWNPVAPIDWSSSDMLPVCVVGEFRTLAPRCGSQGMGGWVHYSLLSGNRTVIDQTYWCCAGSPWLSTEVAILEICHCFDLMNAKLRLVQILRRRYRRLGPKADLFGVA